MMSGLSPLSSKDANGGASVGGANPSSSANGNSGNTSNNNSNNTDAVAVTDFATYEDYLDSQITPIDLYYLEDKDLARQLVELGYRGTGEPLKREEFDARKKAAENSRSTNKRMIVAQAAAAAAAAAAQSNTTGTTTTTTTTSTTTARQAASSMTAAAAAAADPVEQPSVLNSPLLAALAEREDANRSGKMTSILFLRDRNNKNQEISGYIDLAHRFKMENFDDFFNGTKKLLPKLSDMSFYNWETHTCVANATPNFQVVADHPQGILFKNKRDRKVISVDPRQNLPGDTTMRTEIRSPEYIQVVLYDHVIRRKT